MAYLDISRRANWWWQEKTNTSNTNTGSTNGYPEPSDLKEFRELKIGNIFYAQIPFNDNRAYTGTSVIVQLPQTIRSYFFYRYAGSYFLIPADGADGTAHTIHYWCRVSKATSDSSTFLIPDEYLEALTAFAEARYWMSIAQQGKAQAPFQEFEQIVKQMEAENGRRGGRAKIMEPEWAYD